MRILYVHRSLGDGGEGVHIRAMIDAFRARGHTVEVHGPGGDDIDDPGTVTSRTTVSALLARAPGALVELGEIGYGLVDARRAASRARRFGPDVVYARHAAYTTAAVSAARRAGVPLLLEVNAPLSLERAEDELRGLRFPGLAQRWERRCFEAADHLLVVSSPLRDWLRAQGVETPVHVLPNGIHPEAWEDLPDGRAVRQQLELPEDALVIGFVGFIRAWHGVAELLVSVGEAAAAREGGGRPLAALIVGDGPALPQIRETGPARAAPARVAFAGRVAHAEVPRYLAAMDVTVSPRATFYASPLKLLEYLAAGTAVVAPHRPNILDVVEPGRDALTFDPDEPGSLAATLARLAADSDLRERLARHGRRRALTELTWEHNARRVEALARGSGCPPGAPPT